MAIMRTTSFLIAVCAMLDAAAAPAQPYPSRSITLVVPFAPGGSASTVARSVADKMSEELAAQIIIENRPGAGGTVATRAVAKSAPDGSTILLATSATLGTAPSLSHNLGYDPRRDFEPIGLIAATPNVIVVNPDFPARSLADLIRIGRETATPIPYGSPGAGTLNHLTMDLLAHRTGMRLSHVPYKGAGPALNDLIGGHIGVLISAVPMRIATLPPAPCMRSRSRARRVRCSSRRCRRWQRRASPATKCRCDGDSQHPPAPGALSSTP